MSEAAVCVHDVYKALSMGLLLGYVTGKIGKAFNVMQ